MSISRGDIFFVDLGDVQEALQNKNSEQAGKRPVVMLSINRIQDKFNVAVVVGCGTRYAPFFM